jgi:hypothetical protein
MVVYINQPYLVISEWWEYIRPKKTAQIQIYEPWINTPQCILRIWSNVHLPSSSSKTSWTREHHACIHSMRSYTWWLCRCPDQSR